ncbi:MAG: hypothetical protein CMH64_02705 [Nanoarchaeota archaeon]|nr:hypothetical protein [Nanoarchaeota archaeon]|tara:strand:- start:6299 stop:8128 length:1830 start_codon:yes stop_codon:yes gene_type:complete
MKDPQEMSQDEIIDYCLENGLDVFKFIAENYSTKEEVVEVRNSDEENKTSYNKLEADLSSCRNIEEIVLGVLDALKGANNITLDEFTSYVKAELEDRRMRFDEPLKGIISGVLYNHAEKVEHGSEYKKKILHPVTASDLERLLEVSFPEDDLLHISGDLDSGYVRENYELDPDNGFVDEERKIKQIEGTNCWDGSEKGETRGMLTSFVERHLLEELKEEIDDELERFDERRKELEVRLGKVSKVRSKRFYVSGNSSEIGAFNRYFLKGHLGYGRGVVWDKTEGLEFDINIKKGKVDIVARNDEIAKKLLSEWDEYVRRRGKSRNNMAKNIKIVENRIGDKQVREVQGEIDKVVEERAVALLDGMVPAVNYLELGSPNFVSYLAMNKLFEEFPGITLKATIPEYNFRLFNLMKSMNVANTKTFGNVDLVYANLDDLVLLDFVNSSDFVIDQRQKLVRFNGSSMPIEKYREMLNHRDGGISIADLSKGYEIPELFVKTVDDRDRKKFGIVFLDYLGGYAPYTKNGEAGSKKREILRNLAERRLEDNAVVAMTYSLIGRKNTGDNNEIPDMARNHAEVEFASAGYRINDWDWKEYQDNKEKMLFIVYNIRKS